jgi:general stress protein YciG
MPKPVKKTARTILDERMKRLRGQPAADQPILDPETVIREHMQKTAAKGGKVSHAKPGKNPTSKQRPSGRKLAARAALMEHLTRSTANEPDDKPPTFDELYRAHMAELGARGGKTSGAKRMENLSDKARRDIARKGGLARAAKVRAARKKPVRA